MTIIRFYIIIYTQNKYSKLFQIIKGYFSFIYNVNKRKTKIYYKMNWIVSYKTT